MLGEYKDSGFKEPPFLARRADGQVLQLPRLLYLVAASSDGSRSYGQIAEAVTKEFGRGVSADNVQTLVTASCGRWESSLLPTAPASSWSGRTPYLP